MHPGQMGASVGAALVERGVPVWWASRGRSSATRQRAEAAGLSDAGDLAGLTWRVNIVISICPPHAALEVATAVVAAGFVGLYVDANAVAPSTAAAIANAVESSGAEFVDGDVIGGPLGPGARTRLYLSGREAHTIARLLQGSDRGEAIVLGDDPTAASALKMAYAAWTKGTAALLLAIEAASKATGVQEDLFAEWRRSQPDLPDRLAAAHRSLPKAWRWSGEMDEIATCFADVGVPDGFARAAAAVFRAQSDGAPK